MAKSYSKARTSKKADIKALKSKLPAEWIKDIDKVKRKRRLSWDEMPDAVNAIKYLVCLNTTVREIQKFLVSKNINVCRERVCKKVKELKNEI